MQGQSSNGLFITSVLTSDSQDTGMNKCFRFACHQWMSSQPSRKQNTLLSLPDIFTVHELNLHLKADAFYCNTITSPAQKLVSLWQVWIIILKPFRLGVNLVAICLMFVSSLAEMIRKADVLLLENLRYTSKLPYCLYLQMKLELPPIVFVVCPIVPNWRILYSLLFSKTAMAFSRWNCF